MTTETTEPAATGGRHRVELAQTGEAYACLPDENILHGMARLGRRGIPIGCLNGGCGICKIAIETGEWKSTGPMSRAHISAEEEARGIVLACRAAPCTDIRITVLGKMQKGLFKGWGDPAAAFAAAATTDTTSAT